MKRGDLVVALYDEQREIKCIGLVLETQIAEIRRYSSPLAQAKDVKVMWSSEHSPTGWWREDQLRVVNEGKPARD